MKVWILANFDVGLYQFRRELIGELLKKADVTIALPYGPLVKPLVEDGCRFVDTPLDRRGINPFRDLKLWRTYRRLLKRDKPDLVVTYTVKPNVYGGLVCRMRRIPYAANITGLGTAFEKGGALRLLVSVLYKTALKKAKTVFFENAANRDLFLKEKIVTPEQACLLNGAGVNVSRFALAPYPCNEEIRFLFVGRVMREKGIDELLAAMKTLRERQIPCFLDVVGPCEEDYRERFDAARQEGWLRYHGYQEDVRPFIRQADCFVLPSWHEGMANTNLECAACGRPVITSDIPGCREAVVDGESGFLCPVRDEQTLFEMMERFCRLSRDQREQMGLRGRRHMEEEFDKNTIVAQTLSRL
ncbi:MAG: glycosyltransferase family 4 protein [Acutalibacteraceae bacterium]|jgi:glycosyltransferase involved in cell wall biosynthesis